MERRDKRGRRIGSNWWREYIVGSWASADEIWRSKIEDLGYATERDQFAEDHPRPTLKRFMIDCQIYNLE